MNRSAMLATVLSGWLAVGATAAVAEVTHVPAANTKAPGVTKPNVLSPELAEVVRAAGAMRLENPESPVVFYGYNDDRPNFVPLPGGSNVEAHKTEPDKNTYLVLRHQKGADPHYDYGTHFLFQGHESGPGNITRINLDADVAHRVTLIASKDVTGKALPAFDGSTWYPWAQRLLFTAENGANGGVWQATLDFPSQVEDVGGSSGTQNPQARQPNSFVYRLVPYDKHDLKVGGKLQVLAVKSQAHTGDIVFNSVNPDTDITSQDIKDLHTYGKRFDTTWITIHDTAASGFTPFDANKLAKGVGTPFKRPENGMFRPGTNFREFFFTETADTNALTQVGSAGGGFGGLFKVSQHHPADDRGTLTLFYLGDIDHTSFDNISFLTKDHVIAVEDRGDTLHTQHNALDSAWLFDVNLDYSNPANQPIRILAQGRDPSATIDSGLLGSAGFTNDGDNEITGIHVSDGDPTPGGILGAKNPRPFDGRWRVFYTQQHGDNNTYEIILNPSVAMPFHDHDRDSDDD